MIQIDVLVFGNITRDSEGNVLSAYSTSTLVKAGDRNIVVDTSTPEMRPAIKTAFKQIGVFPKDVDTLILTHAHSDHTGNNSMFQNAEIIMHSGEDTTIPGARIIDSERMEITKGVTLVHTPGHTMGSMSVFVESDLKYAIVGDTIPIKSNFEKMVPPRLNCDADLAMKSIKTVTDYADVVVPGHDLPFMTVR